MTDTIPIGEESQAARLAAIRERRQELEEAGLESETLRRLPDGAVEILRELRVFWSKTPRELGGTPLEPLDFCDVIEELAYIDSAVGWAAMIGAGSTSMGAGWLPDEGVAAVFPAGGPLPVLAGQPHPRGRAERVEGGWVVTGRWSFASGINHSNWVLGGFLAGEPPKPLAFVVPKEQAQVIDTWEVAGLRGTGSFEFTLTGVFVPDEWIFDPFGRALRGGALFAQDIRVLVSNEVPPLCIGVARRAIDCMAGLAPSTVRMAGAPALSDRASFLKELGRAEVRVRAARAAHRDSVVEAAAAAASGDEDARQRTAIELTTASVYAVETCVDVVSDLFRYGGGRVLASSHPMQRYLRDLLAARQHVAVSEESYEHAGRALIESRGSQSA